MGGSPFDSIPDAADNYAKFQSDRLARLPIAQPMSARDSAGADGGAAEAEPARFISGRSSIAFNNICTSDRMAG
jgi:hypothetical protein